MVAVDLSGEALRKPSKKVVLKEILEAQSDTEGNEITQIRKIISKMDL